MGIVLQFPIIARRVVKGWRAPNLEVGYDLACESDVDGDTVASISLEAHRKGLGVVQLLRTDPSAMREYKRAGEHQRRMERRGARYTPEGLAAKKARNAAMLERFRAMYREQRATWEAEGRDEPFVAYRVWRAPGPMQFQPRAGSVRRAA